MTKTNYEQSENFKRIKKKIQKTSVNQITAFDHKYEINCDTIQQQKYFKSIR